MEQRAQSKKRYLSASYLTSGAVFYGTLLFLIARVLSLFQLFGEAVSRKKLDQAPPEGFTFLGIIGSLLIIGVIALAFHLLVQQRQKKLRIKQGNFCLLLNVLFIAWGLINVISSLMDMIRFFEFVYFLDFITMIAALIVPSVLLQLTDRKQGIPPDTALLFSAVSATGLSVIAALIVSLVLNKSYTTFQLIRELMFRAGIILFGIAGLIKAVRIRAELPEIVDAVMKELPKYQAQEAAKKKEKANPSGKIECPDCGKKLAPGTEVCPRCGFDLSTPNLFDDEDESFTPEPESAAPPEPEQSVPEPPPEPESPPVRNDICPRCGKRKPPFLSTCPHCGYFPGDPSEPEKPEHPEAPAPAADVPETTPAPRQENRCEKCGRRIPGGLATCPYCGFHPDDARQPQPEENRPPERLFDDEPEQETIFCPRCDREVKKGTQVCPHCGYPFPDEHATGRLHRPTQRLPRVADPKRLNDSNSIDCPECGRRYSAARSVCPYCGYDLYDEEH